MLFAYDILKILLTDPFSLCRSAQILLRGLMFSTMSHDAPLPGIDGGSFSFLLYQSFNVLFQDLFLRGSDLSYNLGIYRKILDRLFIPKHHCLNIQHQQRGTGLLRRGRDLVV